MGWPWLTKIPFTAGFLVRVILRVLALFLLFNLGFAALDLGASVPRISLYNSLVPGRERLPYAQEPARAYSLSLNHIGGMLATHVVSQPKQPDEFRILLIGDSSTWGFLLEVASTSASVLNNMNLQTLDSRNLRFYNLGYPVMSLTKDLLILEAALSLNADLIVWIVSLESFGPERQLSAPLVQANGPAVRRLVHEYDLRLAGDMTRLTPLTFWDKTLVGQRRALSDWMRLQGYGFMWAATGRDIVIDGYTLRQSDFEADQSWQNYPAPTPLMPEDLAFDVLAAGQAMAGDVPIFFVNEPIFISDGRNSDIRYNSFYPRWAYDAYRELFDQLVQERGWHYVDMWNIIQPDAFTDTPVHMTAEGTRQFAQALAEPILALIHETTGDTAHATQR